MPTDDEVPWTGQTRAKLVEAKKVWAREGRLLTGTTSDPARDRLSPGERLVADFPVLDLGVQPDVNRANWRLRVEGLCAAPLRLALPEFLALPQAALRNDIHCVTQWSRYDNDWRGVPVLDLLAMARPKDEARFVALAMDDVARSENLFAHEWAGAPLERIHGGPMRLSADTGE